MLRTRAWRRDMNYRKALHKKYLSDAWFYDGRSWYPKLGYYIKGKIHCSCGMCSRKTRNKGYHRRHIHANYQPSINYKFSDLLKQISMNEQEKEYYGI